MSSTTNAALDPTLLMDVAPLMLSASTVTVSEAVVLIDVKLMVSTFAIFAGRTLAPAVVALRFADIVSEPAPKSMLSPAVSV